MDPYSTQLMIMNYVSQAVAEFKFRGLAWGKAFALIVLGKLVADAVQWLLQKGLKALRWDDLCRTWGWTTWLTLGRVHVSPSEVVLGWAYWLTWLYFIMSGIVIMDVSWFSGLGQWYFTVLPMAAGAAAILAVTLIAAAGLGQWLRLGLQGPTALLVSTLVSGGVVALGAYYALVRLGVETALAQSLVWIVFGGVTLALVIGWVLHSERFLRPVIRVEDTKEVR